MNAVESIFCALPDAKMLSEEARRSISDQITHVWPEIQNVEFNEEGIAVYLKKRLENTAEMSQNITSLAARTANSYEGVVTETIFETYGARANAGDPLPTLLKTRQVVEVLPGAFVLQGALSIGAVEQHCPTTISIGNLIGNGYVDNFPQHIMLVSKFHMDLSEFLSDKSKSQEFDTYNALANGQGHPVQALSPTVCYHCFESLRDQEIEQDELILTAVAMCHRNEGVNIKPLSRLQTFTMREIVFFGKLPNDEQWISCASFNNHQKTLVNSYGLKREGFNNLTSGCVGYGLERMAFTLFAQFGCDLTLWPQPLRKLF